MGHHSVPFWNPCSSDLRSRAGVEVRSLQRRGVSCKTTILREDVIDLHPPAITLAIPLEETQNGLGLEVRFISL